MVVAYFLGIFGVVAFGATLPVTRIALQDFSPEFLTFARATLAAGLAFGSLIWFGKPMRHRDDFQIFIAGIFLIFTFPAFMAIAMQSVPAAHGGVVLGFLPLTTAIFARLIAQETPSARFWVLSISGCAVVTTYVFIKAGSNNAIASWSGYIWLIAAGLTASIGYVIFGKLSRETPGWEIICRSLILNLPLILGGLIWYYDSSIWTAESNSIWAMVYLGSFSMFLAFCAWNIALAIGGIARIGQLQLLQVFVTVAVAALLLGEVIDTTTIITALLVTVIVAATRQA